MAIYKYTTTYVFQLRLHMKRRQYTQLCLVGFESALRSPRR